MGMILNLGTGSIHARASFTLKIEVERGRGHADTKGNTCSIAFSHLTDNVQVELQARLRWDYNG